MEILSVFQREADVTPEFAKMEKKRAEENAGKCATLTVSHSSSISGLPGGIRVRAPEGWGG